MAATERLVIDLPAELVAGLRDSVRSGAFGSESAVVEALLRTWYGRHEVAEPDTEALRALVAEGIADVAAGRFSDAEEVYARVRARIEAVAKSPSR